MAYRISIVTPSYNQGRFIERTLNSVLSQQFSGTLEYFVMDGGSTDETVEILRRYESRLEWRSERDRGQADAVNKGWARATGDIIGWLNSDDIYYPGAFAAVTAAFESNPGIDLLYGDANHIDVEDRLIEPYPTEPWNLDRLADTCYLCQPAVFFRRHLLDRFGLLNHKLHFCLDYEYWLRLGLGHAKVFWLRELLAGSRLYPETKTLGFRVRCHREINSMLRERLGRVPDRWLSNYAHVVLDEKRIARSAPSFPYRVSLLSLYSALRWNYGVSLPMWRMVSGWVSQASRQNPPQGSEK